MMEWIQNVGLGRRTGHRYEGLPTANNDFQAARLQQSGRRSTIERKPRWRKMWMWVAGGLIALVLMYRWVWKTRPCLAVYGEYGNNFNKLIEMYRAFHLIHADDRLEYLVLDDYVPLFYHFGPSESMYHWFTNFVDIDKVATPVVGGLVGFGFVRPFLNRCVEYRHAEELYFMESIGLNNLGIWEMLEPSPIYKREADDYLASMRDKYPDSTMVTVHKRLFEGNCPFFISNYAHKHHPEWYCSMTQDVVLNEIIPHLDEIKDVGNKQLILLSDGQQPEEDKTFENVFPGSFKASIWIMASSDYHIGTNASTIDLVVSKWRKSKPHNIDSLF